MNIGGDAVALDFEGRPVLLKWHMLRRSPDDPPFSPSNFQVGLELGASMEVDIRLLADNNWICLHDAVLDHETSDTGPVAAVDIDAARRLRISGGDFPPPLLGDLTARLSMAYSGAQLQLDLKEGIGAISSDAIAGFASAVSPVAHHCLLSGDDWQAVEGLGAGVPHLRLGFDPHELARRTFVRAADVETFVAEVLEIAPTAQAFYLHHVFVTSALALGHNPIEQLKARGAFVDVWTLDPTTPDISQVLHACIAAGVDQITTNDPPGLAQVWRHAGLSRFGSS
jgi:glycerophosphoryl diester phosphodiesterase